VSSYKAALFAPDGEWVTDYRGDTVEAVWDQLEDRGSRWYFYPYPVVIVDHGGVTTTTQRIVSTGEGYESAKGRTLRTFGQWLAALTDEEQQAFYEGVPVIDWMHA
jgi:glycine/D-amino acid oxidase-like deaminating enzyme